MAQVVLGLTYSLLFGLSTIPLQYPWSRPLQCQTVFVTGGRRILCPEIIGIIHLVLLNLEASPVQVWHRFTI